MAVAIAVCSFLLGCSSAAGGQQVTGTGSPDGATTGAASPADGGTGDGGTGDDNATDSAAPATLPPVTATAAPTLVERQDARPAAERAQAKPADPKSTLSYSNGLTVHLGKVTQATVTEQGPGALTGLKYSLIPVTVTNGSDQTLNLNNVIVELRYGSPTLVAQPVYTEDTKDLSGTLAPGKSAQASYAFGVDGPALKDVTLSLDIDGQHGLAQFKGAL